MKEAHLTMRLDYVLKNKNIIFGSVVNVIGRGVYFHDQSTVGY